MEGLLIVYYSFIHTFLNYRNLSGESTHKAKLKKIASRQK